MSNDGFWGAAALIGAIFVLCWLLSGVASPAHGGNALQLTVRDAFGAAPLDVRYTLRVDPPVIKDATYQVYVVAYGDVGEMISRVAYEPGKTLYQGGFRFRAGTWRISALLFRQDREQPIATVVSHEIRVQ